MRNFLTKIKYILIKKGDDYNKKDKDCSRNLYLNKKSSKIFSYFLLNIFTYLLYYSLVVFIPKSVRFELVDNITKEVVETKQITY